MNFDIIWLLQWDDVIVTDPSQSCRDQSGTHCTECSLNWNARCISTVLCSILLDISFYIYISTLIFTILNGSNYHKTIKWMLIGTQLLNRESTLQIGASKMQSNASVQLSHYLWLKCYDSNLFITGCFTFFTVIHLTKIKK